MIVAFIVAFLALLVSKILFNSNPASKKERRLPNGNVVILDIETNGFPTNWKASVSDTYNWPRMVSISWFKIAPSGAILSQHSFIIKPNGFTIQESAVAIHGITTEQAIQIGTEPKDVLQQFETDISDAAYLVAHNIDFDYPVLLCEYIRSNVPQARLKSLQQICTMKSSMKYCNIRTSKGLKYPKLGELYKKLFNNTLSGAHTSKADAEACMKCFKELYNLNIITF